VDPPIHRTQKVLVAVEDAENCKVLTQCAAELIVPIPGLHFTLLHLVGPVPAVLWEEGHILSPEEEKDRQMHLHKWLSGWAQEAEKYMGECRNFLAQKGVAPENVETKVRPMEQGIARDLLNEIKENQYEILVIGKKSFRKKKPFLMGSHANKLLQSAKGVILCMVSSP
jgi:nucleotide-binding universal stress UspA family protein